MIILKNEWEVLPIAQKEATDFITEHHYGNGCANTSVARFGLFFKGDHQTLHGVSMWMPPIIGAGKKVCQDPQTVLSLSRFCLRDDRPDNSGSFLLSHSVQMLDQLRWKIMLTYADSAQGHTGGLYRATNWMYHGKTLKARTYTDPETGKMVSKKSGPNNRSHQDMLDLGYEAGWSDGKFRFVLPVHRKTRGRINKITPDDRVGMMFTANGYILADDEAA